MQLSVQLRTLNREASHDKGSTPRGFARCPRPAWPGRMGGNQPWFRAPDGWT